MAWLSDDGDVHVGRVILLQDAASFVQKQAWLPGLLAN